MKIKPLFDRVLIQRDKAATVSKGGIVLPETSATKRPAQAAVLACGEKVSKVAPGDRVLVAPLNGTVLQDGPEFVKEEEILAVLEG